MDYIEGTECYHLYNIKNGSIIKSRDVNFVECKDCKQMEETLKISINKLQETRIKIESMESSLDLKNNIEDIMEDLDTGKGHQQPPIESSSFV